MNLLALDTSTEACSAALYSDGKILERYQLAPREHSQLILDMLDDLLAESELSLAQMNAVAFGCGPGSFVGVRIAAGVTQGIAYAADLPVIAISSLAALAQTGGQTHTVAAIDARMQEVYWAHYVRNELGLVELQQGEGVCAPHSVPAVDQKQVWTGVGTGWASYHETLSQHLTVKSWLGDVYPRAACVAELAVLEYEKGNLVGAEQAIPSYLRDQVAKRPGL